MGTLGRAIYMVGSWIRSSGQAIDRLGLALQGNHSFQEQISRHRSLLNLYGTDPVIDGDAFVAPSASVIGDVHVGRGSSIWYGCVLRGSRQSIFAKVVFPQPGGAEINVSVCKLNSNAECGTIIISSSSSSCGFKRFAFKSSSWYSNPMVKSEGSGAGTPHQDTLLFILSTILLNDTLLVED